MEKTCSNCGAATPPEARYCRHCGAPLRTVATYGSGGGETISPLAQTVPLSGEGLTTDNLGAEQDGGTVLETKRVVRAEMEQLLRHSRFNAAPDGKPDGDGTTTVISDYAAPPTGELVQAAPTPVAAIPAPAQSAQRAPAATRPRRSWVLATTLLLLATLFGALLAYYFLRQRATQSAATVTNVTGEANGNQAAEPANSPVADSPVAEGGVEAAEAPDVAPPQPEATATPAPKTSASIEATHEARARQERETEAPALAGTPTPAPSASPLTQATPAQTQTPAPARSNSDAQTAQANSDTFYFQAVSVVNGRAPRSLPRAELLRALQLFQNVVSGPHVAEARKQAAQLGRELDRLNKQSQR
jgi:hypothetical protein